MRRWAGNNGPEQADYVAVRNLIDATPRSVKRFLLTTSAGVDRSDKLPFSILNLFGAFLDGHPRCQLPLLCCHKGPRPGPGGGNCQRFVQWRAAVSCRGAAAAGLVGVLKWKKEGERLLQQSGLPWTIVRPNRLTDGPYTSYDLNTLLQARLSALFFVACLLAHWKAPCMY